MVNNILTENARINYVRLSNKNRKGVMIVNGVELSHLCKKATLVVEPGSLPCLSLELVLPECSVDIESLAVHLYESAKEQKRAAEDRLIKAKAELAKAIESLAQIVADEEDTEG